MKTPDKSVNTVVARSTKERNKSLKFTDGESYMDAPRLQAVERVEARAPHGLKHAQRRSYTFFGNKSGSHLFFAAPPNIRKRTTINGKVWNPLER